MSYNKLKLLTAVTLLLTLLLNPAFASEAGSQKKSISVPLCCSGVGLIAKKSISSHKDIVLSLGGNVEKSENEVEGPVWNIETQQDEVKTINTIHRQVDLNLELGIRNYFEKGEFSPFFEYSLFLQKSYIKSNRRDYRFGRPSEEIYTTNRNGVGISGTLGVEWFIVKRFSLTGYYSASLLYVETERESNYSDNGKSIIGGDSAGMQASWYW